MRIFDHLYSRYIVGKMKKAGTNDPDAGFLKEDATEWVPQHFKKVSPPAVHQMVLTLEKRGFIERRPGQAHTIRVLVPPEDLPALD